MTEAPRTRCEVPFCKRTIKGAWSHWLCSEHWRLVDSDLKRLRTKLFRKYERLGEAGRVKGGLYWGTARAWRTACGLNKRMTRQATERAAGIG